MASINFLLAVTFYPILLLHQPVKGLNFYSHETGFFRSHSELLTVPDDIQEGAPGVDLGYNKISLLREDVFSKLTQCTRVNLWWNQIADIETGSFNGLYACGELFLANNRLTELRYGMFIGLESLQKLYLNDNELITIKDGSFAGLNSLEELWLSNNKLKVLKYKMLRGITNLKVLKLWGNDIEFIESGSFSGPVNLRELWMAGNSLKEIRYDVFIGLGQLEHLYLGWNQIAHIEDDAFLSLSNLTFLDLQNNAIKDLGSKTLIGLESLTKLILKDNQLSSLKAHTMVSLPRPLALSLSDNPLVCDCEMCWLPEEEQNGTVTWDVTSQSDGKPQCLGVMRWDDWVCPSNGSPCPDPGVPTNGSRQGNAPFTCNSVVTYSCDDGYWLAGAPSLACGNDGNWSSVTPECRLKRNSVLITTAPPPTMFWSNNGALWVGLIVGVGVVCSVISAIITSCVCRHLTTRRKESNFPEFSIEAHGMRDMAAAKENEYEVMPNVTRAQDNFAFPSYKDLNGLPDRTMHIYFYSRALDTAC